MSKIRLHVELPAGADQHAIAREIQTRLAALNEVDQVAARPESTRFVAETIAGIAVVVSIIKGSQEIAEALHSAIPKIKLVLQDLGLSQVKVEVAGERIPIDEVDRSHTHKISA